MPTGTAFEYDVALSFAGEDRPYVAEVARALSADGIRVFYDENERASLWGRDLYQHLSSVYKDRALYVVVFISANYSRKLWTSHELQSAQARAFSESSEYILPARFDDTEIPGILPTTGYIDLRRLTPTELSALIKLKLSSDLTFGRLARSNDEYLRHAARVLRPNNVENIAFTYIMLTLERSYELRVAGHSNIRMRRDGDTLTAESDSSGVTRSAIYESPGWWALGAARIHDEVAGQLIRQLLAGPSR
jgi:hypothetical protein